MDFVNNDLKVKLGLEAPESNRLFHVTFWNNRSGTSLGSIGDVSKQDDPSGAHFRKLFGYFHPPEATLNTPKPVYKITKEEFRSGNTCRRPSGDADCQYKFPR